MKELKCDLNSAGVANCATELHPERATKEEKRERDGALHLLSWRARGKAQWRERAGGGNMELDIRPRVRTQDPSRFERFGNFCPINEFN